MKLQRREQAYDTTWHALTGFSEAMILCNLGVWEFVLTSGFFHQKSAFLKAL
jgi:hypothetical protein